MGEYVKGVPRRGGLLSSSGTRHAERHCSRAVAHSSNYVRRSTKRIQGRRRGGWWHHRKSRSRRRDSKRGSVCSVENLRCSAPTGPRVVATGGVRQRRTEPVEQGPRDPPAPAGRRMVLQQQVVNTCSCIATLESAGRPWSGQPLLQDPTRIFSSGQAQGQPRLQKTRKEGSIVLVESVRNPACWSGSALHNWRKA